MVLSEGGKLSTFLWQETSKFFGFMSVKFYWSGFESLTYFKYYKHFYIYLPLAINKREIQIQ